MLFAPDFAIVLGGHLEQFQMPICGNHSALIAQTLHFRSTKRLKVNRYPKILFEHLHTVDAADGHGNRQAHGIANPWSL